MSRFKREQASAGVVGSKSSKHNGSSADTTSSKPPALSGIMERVSNKPQATVPAPSQQAQAAGHHSAATLPIASTSSNVGSNTLTQQQRMQVTRKPPSTGPKLAGALISSSPSGPLSTAAASYSPSFSSTPPPEIYGNAGTGLDFASMILTPDQASGTAPMPIHVPGNSTLAGPQSSAVQDPSRSTMGQTVVEKGAIAGNDNLKADVATNTSSKPQRISRFKAQRM